MPCKLSWPQAKLSLPMCCCVLLLLHASCFIWIFVAPVYDQYWVLKKSLSHGTAAAAKRDKHPGCGLRYLSEIDDRSLEVWRAAST